MRILKLTATRPSPAELGLPARTGAAAGHNPITVKFLAAGAAVWVLAYTGEYIVLVYQDGNAPMWWYVALLGAGVALLTVAAFGRWPRQALIAATVVLVIAALIAVLSIGVFLLPAIAAAAVAAIRSGQPGTSQVPGNPPVPSSGPDAFLDVPNVPTAVPTMVPTATDAAKVPPVEPPREPVVISAAKLTMTDSTETSAADSMDPLTSAVVETERYANGKGWGQSPQLYSLIGKAAMASAGEELAAEFGGLPPGSLIALEQRALEEGELTEVLATIGWSDEVRGCVIVTEVVVLPAEAGLEAPQQAEAASVEEWAEQRPDARAARLAVGVLRDGTHACCLRLDDDDVLVDTGLADDLVTALLGTF